MSKHDQYDVIFARQTITPHAYSTRHFPRVASPVTRVPGKWALSARAKISAELAVNRLMRTVTGGRAMRPASVVRVRPSLPAVSSSPMTVPSGKNKDSLPACLEVTAWTLNEQGELDEIMGVRHRELPIEGVQFHPESILTQHGHAMLRNFLKMS